MKQRSNKKPVVIASLPDFGKVPPQASDMEEAVLGAVMLESMALNSVIDILKPESFYREAHQKIFAAIMDLSKRGKPVDIFTVTEELRAHGELESVGGPVYITVLSSKVISAANVDYHARIVQQKYMQREIIRVGTILQTQGFDDTLDVAEIMDYAETNLLEISGAISKKKAVTLGSVVYDVVAQVSKIQSGEIKLVGVPTGFTNMDRSTGGLKKQEFIILAGRPSTGKTSLACQIAKNTAMFGYPVAIFSCEMSKEELGRRYLSGESGRTNIELLNGRCSLDSLSNDAIKLSRLPIYIDDTSAISTIELRAKVRRMIMEYGIKLVIVDYLQLMTGEGQSREQEVSYISRNLKSIAKDMDIPVLALSQLNRGVENRGDKKPNLSDLRESGAIEQDADVVLFTYPPAKFGISDIDLDGMHYNTEGLLLVLISKNRNGPVCEIALKHNKPMSVIMQEDEFKPDPIPGANEIPANMNFDNEHNNLF